MPARRCGDLNGASVRLQIGSFFSSLSLFRLSRYDRGDKPILTMLKKTGLSGRSFKDLPSIASSLWRHTKLDKYPL
jgi:hypothetical protein